MTKAHTLYFTAIFALIFGAILVTGSPQLKAYPLKEGNKEREETFKANLNLKNFQPGASVTYKILSPDRLMFEGVGQTDGSGALSLLYPETGDQNGYLVYDLEIRNPQSGKALNEALNILLRVDNEKNQITASGQGAETFSDIIIKTSSQNIRTRADWAGLFREQARFERGDASSQQFQIALHGADAFRLPGDNQKNPAIIEILTATGGGGPSDSGVNEFEPSPQTPFPLSTSDRAKVDGSIQGITERYIRAMMMMTEQLSAVSMLQMLQVGQFFDAKHQLETQRLHQTLKAEAVKDYHPSEQMCRVGSYIRSIAKAEQKSETDKRILNEIMASRFVNEAGQSTAEGAGYDSEARLKQYREVYCDIRDNNNGLDFMCDHEQDRKPDTGKLGADDKKRVNKDIDFVRTLEHPYTLKLDFAEEEVSEDEEDIIALAKNLYWLEPFTFANSKDLPDKASAFLDARRVIALNSIAHNSFATLAGMKAQAAEPEEGVEPGWAFMKALMKEFGFADNEEGRKEIEALIGERPSYWAQMDFLTKKIYQNPDFYTNLYDKPANVDRMSVVLEAMKIMQLRDHFDSSLRREMINAAMVENELSPQYQSVETLLASPR